MQPNIKTNVKKDTIKKIIRIIVPGVLLVLLLLLTLKTAHAADSYLGTEWDKYLRGGIDTGSKTGEDLAVGFIQNLVRILRYIIGGVALIMGTIYGISFIFARGKEDTITKQKQNFLWIFVGFIILIVAENVARIFNPEEATSTQLVNFEAARDQLREATTYIKWLLGSVFVLLMTISGIKMATAGSNEENITKQKRNLVFSLIGMLIILLASNIVNAIYVIRSPNEIVSGGPTAVTGEVASIIKLILVFLGPAAVAFTIIAGFFYLTAFDNEERSKKAKQMIVGGITGIVLIYSAYAIVNTFAAEKSLTFLPALFT
jgi:hypothetical protein